MGRSHDLNLLKVHSGCFMKHRLLLFSREVGSDLATPGTAARVASTGWKAAKEVVGRWMLREFHRAEMRCGWDEMRWQSLDQRGAKLTDSKKKSLGGERAGTLWLDGAVGEWRGGFNVSPSDPGHREWFTIPKTGFEGQGRGRHLVTVWAPEWLSRL